MLFMILGAACAIGGLICWLIILIDAFKNEIWKGIVGLLCCLYLFYYALVEFQHEKKIPIILGWLFLGTIGSVLMNMSGMMPTAGP